MLSDVRSLMLPTLIKVKQWVVGCASHVFASACTALLYRFVFRLFICLVVDHDSRWRHVSFWWDVHRSYIRDISCLKRCSFCQFPKYVPYLNLRVCVICALVIQLGSHNRFDHFMCMFMLIFCPIIVCDSNNYSGVVIGVRSWSCSFDKFWEQV